MSLWDLFKGKARRRSRQSPTVEQARERELVAASDHRVRAMDALAVRNPELLAVMLFPKAGKLMASLQPAASGGSDRLTELLMKKLELDVFAKPPDPLDQLFRLQKAAGAYRELQEELSPEPVRSAPEGAAGAIAEIVTGLANSPFGAQFGAALGQAVAPRNGSGPVAAVEYPAPPQPAAHPQLAAVQPPPATGPAVAPSVQGIPAPNPLLVQGMLAMLRARPPETMAAILIDKASEHEDLATLLDVVLDSRDEDLPVLLNGWVQLPGWSKVAAWLLENYEYTVALVVELRRLADEADQEQPDPEA